MRKLASILLIIILILLNSIVVNATKIAELTFSSNSQNVDINSEITIYLKLNSVSEIEGLTGLSAILNYDKDIFELVKISGEEDWSVRIGENGKMTALSQVIGGESSGNIMKIELKAIKKPEEGTAAVELKNIMLTDGKVEEPHDDISYKINIRGQSTSPDLPENPDVDGENNNNLNNTEQESEDKNTSSLSVSGTTTQQNTTNDGTTSNTKLPAAGLNVTIILVLVLAIILGTAALVKYRKNK